MTGYLILDTLEDQAHSGYASYFFYNRKWHEDSINLEAAEKIVGKTVVRFGLKCIKFQM